MSAAAVRPDADALPDDAERVAAVLSRLAAVKGGRGQWTARCPAHADRSPSLSVSQGRDGRVLLKCHVGCTPEAVVQAIGLTLSDLFAPAPSNGRAAFPFSAARAGHLPAPKPAPPPPPQEVPRGPDLTKTGDDPATWPVAATYDYADADGALAYQVVRKERPGGGAKTFLQRTPDPASPAGWRWGLNGTTRTLYRLPELLEDLAAERTVWLVEGEKDVETARALGLAATTHSGGAAAWSDSFAAPLAGADVVVVPDKDEAGRSWARQAGAALAAVGARVRMLALPGVPDKGDLSDWVALKGGASDAARAALDALLANAAPWAPGDPVPDPDARPTRWRLDALWADDVVMRPPPPVVPRLAWAGRSTLLAAAEKTGKSTLTGYVAAQVSRGGTFLDEPCERGVVLVVGLEEYVGDLARRLRHFHADPTRVFVVTDLPGDPHERPQAIERHIRETGATLVIVDTLIAYGAGAIQDASSSSQTGPVVNALTTIAHDTGVALVLVHHARKADGRYRDSSAIGGAVDVIVEVFAPEEDADPTLRRARARGRVPARDFTCRFDGTHYLLVSGGDAPVEQRITEFVRANPGASLRAVREAVKGRLADVDAALTRLVAAGRLLDDGGQGHRSFRVPSFGSAAIELTPPDTGRTHAPHVPTPHIP